MATVPLDIPAIMRVMERAFNPAFGEAWTRNQFVGALGLPATRCRTVDATGRIDGGDRPPVGFALSRRVADEEELLLIAVDPDHRGNGHAAALLHALVTSARASGMAKVFLEMREDNDALALYRRFAFQPIGRRRKYYRGQDGIIRDAITYGLQLDS